MSDVLLERKRHSFASGRRKTVRNRHWDDLVAVVIFAAIGLAVVVTAVTLGGINAAQAGELETPTIAASEGATQPAANAAAQSAAAPMLGVDSVGPNSNLAAFLEPGVPADVTRAALRKAWHSDPEIRDFIGMSGDAPADEPEGVRASMR